MSAFRISQCIAAGLIVLLIPLSGCHKPISVESAPNDQTAETKSVDFAHISPADAIAAFASNTKGDWDPEFGMLGYEHGTQSPNFARMANILPPGSTDLVKHLTLAYNKPALDRMPILRDFRNLVDLRLSGNQITNIDALSGLHLRYVSLDENPIASISALSSCTDLTGITASGTNITHLPDLSRLSKLQSLVVGETPLTTLDGIQTLPSKIDLVVTGCRQLADISALLSGRVNRFVVDDEMLQRFKPWLDAHQAELRKANPDFEATTFNSGE